MKDFNFDKLKNVKTPDSWIENAVNIPNVHKKHKKVIPFNTRVIATAACFALCFVLGSVMLPIVNTDPTTVVRPLTEPATENTDSTEYKATGQNTGDSPNSTDPTFSTNSDLPPVIILPDGETVTVYPSNNKGGFYPKGESSAIKNGDTTQSTETVIVTPDSTTETAVTEPAETVSVPQDITVPTFVTEPVETESSSSGWDIPVVTEATEYTTSATIPVTNPTVSPSVKPTKPVEPTEPSCVEPTEPIEPTDATVPTKPIYTQPTVAPTQPTEETAPTVSTVPTTENNIFKSSVIFYPSNISDYTNDVNVYCHIVGTDGREYAQRFSSAEVSNVKSNYIVYNPYNSLGALTMDRNKYYDIYFYTSSFTSKTYRCYLGANNYYIIE
ncbi:MAG: hypothetical protein ACI4RM_05845 [Ruminococcus sp.]